MKNKGLENIIRATQDELMNVKYSIDDIYNDLIEEIENLENEIFDLKEQLEIAQNMIDNFDK